MESGKAMGIGAALVLSATMAAGQSVPQADRPPVVFDVHLHALAAGSQGPPPLAMCTPWPDFGAWDPATPYGATFMEMMKNPRCKDPIWSPTSDEELRKKTLEELAKHNVIGVLSGDPKRVERWMEAAPGRFLPGLGFNVANTDVDPEQLRSMVASGRVEVLAEVGNQYAGIAPDDEQMAPYWALAEELDLPVGIHIGTGPPGVHYLGASGYRARLHSALTLEPVLVRHPKLRVYIMHAGFPMLDDLLALLYAHPQVHVGVGVIVTTQSRATFYRYLEAIVDAGFGKRVMFGSDQMVWPEMIGRGIEVIEQSPFLSDEQKRDILFNNAARFFRLSDEQMKAQRLR